MANGSSRLVPTLLALLVGLAIGWFIPKSDQDKPDNYLIGVHADGKLTREKVHISKGLKNIVAWAADGQASLEIAFPEERFPKGVKVPPFAGMTSRPGEKPGTTEWVVGCGGYTCFSGDINPDLQAILDQMQEPKRLEYKYDQIVAHKRTDGMIIIQP